MNVLLIDDDRFVVGALQKKIDWASLSVTEIFTAYNVCQAKKILENNIVEICVCDIEMPGESGLDLLSWVREENLDTQFIFLTSYADFNYARKALSLSSLDYQLKPIDFGKLYEILEKATDKVTKNAALNKTKADSEYWHHNYQNIVNLFWKELLTNPMLAESTVLEREMRRKNIPYHWDDLFLPVLFKLYPSPDIQKELDSTMIYFSFDNITAETLQNSCILYESLLSVRPYEYILLIGNIHLAEVRYPLTEALQTLFTNLQNFMKMDVSCCVSEEVPIIQLSDTIHSLRAMQENNLSMLNTPLFLSDYIPKKISYIPPSLDVIGTFLEQKQSAAALQVLKKYMDSLTAKKEINRELLRHLRLDIEQLVFSYLQKNGIEAHTLFCDAETDSLLSKSLESANYMMDYLQHIITRGLDYSRFITQEESVIDIILNYIHQHYSDDITRTMLADLVYLNPDYMARLFKKQTHTSLINYITEYRMEKAKELLQNPDIPIGTVASSVGYGNYSYFSKLFKDIVGSTPNEYRKKSENKEV